MKRTLATGGVVATLLLVPLGVADAADASPAAAPSVTVSATDRDCAGDSTNGSTNDSTASGTSTDGTSTAPSTTSSSAPSSSGFTRRTGSGDENCAASGDGTSSSSSSSQGDDEGSDDQVSLVPDGGAPTGDGSTEGTSAPYWIGGGLAALLAAAGVTLRKRLFTRS